MHFFVNDFPNHPPGIRTSSLYSAARAVNFKAFLCTGTHKYLLCLQRMSYETFVQLYEKPRIPVVITGLQDTWKAQQLWNPTDLSRRFGSHKFKVCMSQWETLFHIWLLLSSLGHVDLLSSYLE